MWQVEMTQAGIKDIFSGIDGSKGAYLLSSAFN